MGLILCNADVITMDASHPRARAVAVDSGRIVAVGSDAEMSPFQSAGSRLIDCRGGALLPGFIDAHCHLLSYAASLLSVDCSPAAVSSIAGIQDALRRKAAQASPGTWLRATGYDETALAEGRHPTRWELDAAAPDHPVRLIHRSGHACVLNSLALSLAGITIATEEPPGGYLERDTTTGEPSGLLIEMNEIVDAVIPPLSGEELAQGVEQAVRVFLSQGVTSIQDATAGNGPAEWATFRRLIEGGRLPLGVTLMEGFASRGQMPPADLPGRLRRGPVKIAIKEVGDDIYPDEEGLAAVVEQVHREGRQVAIHAVGERAVTAAVAAIKRALSGRPRADHRHRIEHCGVCPPELAGRIGRAGIAVVTQPSFLYFNGDRYLAQVPPSDLPHLYPLGRLHRAGVEVASSSDAPVVSPQPLRSIESAITRRTRDGVSLSPEEALDVEDALRCHTWSAAWAAFEEGERGSIASGKDADLVLLSGDPTAVPPDDITTLIVEMTIIGGEVAWQRSHSAAATS
jgi:predicted amidohydrolase YtcJ